MFLPINAFHHFREVVLSIVEFVGVKALVEDEEGDVEGHYFLGLTTPYGAEL